MENPALPISVGHHTMKYFIKFFTATLLLATTTSALAYFFWYKPKFSNPPPENTFSYKHIDNGVLFRLKQKAVLAKEFVKNNDYEAGRCFLIDMKIPSGEKRFFVYDLRNDSVEKAGLVAHGSGSDTGGEVLYFSNSPNSNCTSLGKYRVGKPYTGKFGLAYKLYGLDNTNSKAFERFVVLHAHSCVPNADIAPMPICESWGCPTVAPAFLQSLKNYIDKSEQPVLLWIYY